jgi:hypothetical protein
MNGKRTILGAAAAVCVPLAIALAGAAGPTGKAEGPFSHKKHAALKLRCAFCHVTVDKEEQAGFPEVARCKSCHTEIEAREIPSARVYKLADFVFFSHARHGEAKVECAGCHGEVNESDAIKPVRSTKMIDCVNCHKERKATIACNSCHELGQ